MTAGYDLAGDLTQLTYPNGEVVRYNPDSAGQILSAVDSGNGINFVTGATYGPDSSLTGFISGCGTSFAGITNAFSYNKRLQPINMSANAPSQTVFSIGYDFHVGNGTSGADNGNVFGITNYKDATRNQTFTYDPMNRLSSAQNAGTDCNSTVLGGNKKFWVTPTAMTRGATCSTKPRSARPAREKTSASPPTLITGSTLPAAQTISMTPRAT